MGLLFAITVFWVFCLGVYFLSKDEKKIAFAANMIQTVLGFYIGVFTGLMGLPVLPDRRRAANLLLLAMSGSDATNSRR